MESLGSCSYSGWDAPRRNWRLVGGYLGFPKTGNCPARPSPVSPCATIGRRSEPAKGHASPNENMSVENSAEGLFLKVFAAIPYGWDDSGCWTPSPAVPPAPSRPAGRLDGGLSAGD